jgi:hypothetical protein
MAIAFRSAGAVTNNFGVIPTPPGFASGDLLLAVITQDANANDTPPVGWTRQFRVQAGTSGGSLAVPKAAVYTRIATGSEGSSQTWTFSGASWPTGNPTSQGVILAYTGVDPATPLESVATTRVTAGGADTQAHPQATTSANNAWLLTLRSRGGPNTTFTCSVGTDTERVDTWVPDLGLAFYDSGALSPGTQTQRSTTPGTSGGSMGDVMATLVLKPASAAGATVAQAGVAQAVGTARQPSVVATFTDWDLCTPANMPVYQGAVDWDSSGMTAAGSVLTTNAYTPFDLSGWAASNSAISWTADLVQGRKVPAALVVPNGVSASGGMNATAATPVARIVPGQNYVADCWVYCPPGWTDLRACVDWYDASGAFLSSGLGAATVVPAGAWTHLTQSLTAPASSSRALVRARFGGTPASSVTFYVFGLMLMDPSLPENQFTPGPTDVTFQDLFEGTFTSNYGRDQTRQYTPAALGSAGFILSNANRVYSPENAGSVLAGNLDAARTTALQVLFNGTAFPIFHGRLDDFTVSVDRSNRSVSFSALDDEAGFQTTPVTTSLYNGIRTGTAVGIILDSVGWTGPRDLDVGATVMPWWWLDSVNAGTALNDLVASEGPPAIFYIAPDGTAVFRDRTHRLLRPQSTVVQGSYASQLVDCAAPAVTGLSFTPPFTYDHGWKNIVNTVQFDIPQRQVSQVASVLWQSTDPLAISNGITVPVAVTTTDPFSSVIPLDPAQDYVLTGAGTLSATFSQTSGGALTMYLTAVGGDIVVVSAQLRGYSVGVLRTIRVQNQDSGSIAQHGTQGYTGTNPVWAGAEDAFAICSILLEHYAQRRPIVKLRVVTGDSTHYLQVVQRTVSDLINIQNDELGMNSGFYVESVAHTVGRVNKLGQPPVHAVVLGCEQQSDIVGNPFTFDQRGAGFDQGVFDALSSDDPSTVFVFDSGCFDLNLFGT